MPFSLILLPCMFRNQAPRPRPSGVHRNGGSSGNPAEAANRHRDSGCLERGPGGGVLFPYCGLATFGEGRTQPAVERAAAKKDRKSTRLNSSHITISYAV